MVAPKTLALALVSVLLVAGNAVAGQIRVFTSGGFTAPYDKVIPEYERANEVTILTAYGASMGGAPDSIPTRLERGEPADVVILAATALEELIKQGKVVPGSRSQSGAIQHWDGGAGGSAEARHQYRGGAQENAARVKLDCVFCQCERDLSLHRFVSAPGDCRSDQSEEPAHRKCARRSTWSHAGTPKSAFSRSANCCPSRGSSMSDRCRMRFSAPRCSRLASSSALKIRKGPERSLNTCHRRQLPLPSSRAAWSRPDRTERTVSVSGPESRRNVSHDGRSGYRCESQGQNRSR